ncbi:hypothetical protein GN244_ATG16202 [Phytophthora infestans]|uniref:Uncharacterized protein n=1 Tax=Phytophthora infestans TaxID=4787 RepID=A0A833W6P5_PHYIN|nr:hypothetical protein GN244_ATG16202 [Phytophthora infestans]
MRYVNERHLVLKKTLSKRTSKVSNGSVCSVDQKSASTSIQSPGCICGPTTTASTANWACRRMHHGPVVHEAEYRAEFRGQLDLQQRAVLFQDGSRAFWVAVEPTDFVSGVQILSINGQETVVINSTYYLLIDGSGTSVADLGSVGIS